MNDRPKMLLALQKAPSSVELVDQASAWAERLGHTLHLTTIVERRRGVDPFRNMDGLNRAENPSIPRETKYWLNEMLDRVPVAVRGGVEIVLGDTTPALVNASAGVDLLVMGSHHRANAARLFLGSVAEAVVRGAQCSVMVLSTGSRSLPVDGSVKVRLPIDPSRPDTAGIDWLAQNMPKADATAVYAVPWLRIFGPNPQSGTRVFNAASEALRTALEQAGHGAVAQLVVIREEGNSGDAIASEAAEAHADLIVLPTQRRSGPLRAVLGSVAERTVRAATMAVVVV